MQRYIVARLGQVVATLFGLSLVVFLSVHLTGDPAAYLLGPDAGIEDYEQIKKNLGLDKPLHVQYSLFLSRVVRADFGRSHITGQPARKMITQRILATLELASAAFLLTVVIGVPLGILSAVKRDTILDTLGKLFAVVGIAAPNFWIAIMLIMLFGAILGWLPTFGHGGIDHLILPAFVLGWQGMAGMVRLSRSSMLEVLDSEYIKFAHVKGLPERVVIYKHALRNAVVTPLTFAGLTLAGLLNGAVVVEVVFAWPGIGRLMLEGIQRRDFPVVQATVLTSGFLYIASSLIVDILYVYVDPRIRLEQ